MFFFAVFGVSDEQSTIGQLPNVHCPACGAYTNLSVEKTNRVFKAYFLPVWKWGERYTARTYCCSAHLEVPEEVGRALERQTLDFSSVSPSTWRILHRSHQCACGHPVDPAHSYCPHCGQPIKEDR